MHWDLLRLISPRGLVACMQGVKGLLEQAGHQVFNPTLPFHAPYDHWSWMDGQMTVQKYVDVYIQVGAKCMCQAAPTDRS